MVNKSYRNDSSEDVTITVCSDPYVIQGDNFISLP